MAFNNLARAWIDYPSAIRPASRRAMNPLNHVVAEVHGIRAFGHQLDAKRALVAGGLKSLTPPTCPFEKHGTNGFRRTAIQVIHDGLNRLAARGRWIFLLQTMSCREALHDGLADRRGVVHVGNAKEARARGICARFVSGCRKLDEGVVLAHGDSLW